MTVRISVSINFEASSVSEAEAEVTSWALPEGASIVTFASQTLESASGKVEAGGTIVAPITTEEES